MKLNIVTWGIPMVGLLLSGCSRGVETDVSPDAKLLVQTSDDGLVLKRVDGAKRASLVYRGLAGSPAEDDEPGDGARSASQYAVSDGFDLGECG